MINADNPAGKLLPGMTANVVFEIAQYTDVVKIPNSALRFTPPASDLPPPPAGEAPAAPKPGGRRERKPPEAKVWITGPTGLTSVTVTAGATDGTFTQLVKGDVKEGQEVIVGLQIEGSDAMTNPFSPRLGGGRGPR